MTEPAAALLRKARLFARYHYAPAPNWAVLQLFDDDFAALQRELAQRSKAELLAMVGRAASAVFERAFAGARGDIVIPLSGGRDSRFILAMALEHGLAARVRTLTWGAPGGLDPEIAAKVAVRAGVRHVRIDILDHQLEFEDLRRAFDNGADWTDLVYAHFNQIWRTLAGPEACAVIGYLGGPTAGAHADPAGRSDDLAAAQARFEALNCLHPRGRAIAVDAARLIDPARVAYAEQLDLVFRQEGYLRRILAPARFDVRTPFADPAWIRLMYALPVRYRAHCALYSDFLHYRYPRLFDIGVSGAYGGAARGSRLERRVRRQLVRAARWFANLGRDDGFATLSKYGDPRDLARLLQRSYGEPGAAAYDRLLRARPAEWTSTEAAAHWRARAMLACNLAFSQGERADPAAEAQIASTVRAALTTPLSERGANSRAAAR